MKHLRSRETFVSESRAMSKELALAISPRTSQEELLKLASSNDSFVRRTVAARSDIGEEIQRKIFDGSDYKAIEALAENPALAPSVMLDWAKLDNTFVASWLLKRGELPEEVWDELLKLRSSIHPIDIIAVNRDTPPHILLRIIEDERLPAAVRRDARANLGKRDIVDFALGEATISDLTGKTLLSIAQDPNTQPGILAALGGDGDYRIVKAISSNPSTPPETLDRLSKSLHDSVRVNVAANPNTAESTLTQLCLDSSMSTSVIEAVIDNPNVTVEVLQTILDTCTLIGLRRRAEDRLKEKDVLDWALGEAVGVDDDTIARAEDPNTSPEELDKLMSVNNYWIDRAIARNLNASPETLDKLADSGVKLIVVENPKTSEYTLDRLCTDYSSPLLTMSIIKHPKATADILMKIIDACPWPVTVDDARSRLKEIDVLRWSLGESNGLKHVRPREAVLESQGNRFPRHLSDDARTRFFMDSIGGETSPKKLEEWSRDHRPLVVARVVQNPNCPKRVLDRLVTHQNEMVRLRVAERYSELNDSSIYRLAQDHSSVVTRFLVGEINYLPERAAEQLLLSNDQPTRDGAAQKIKDQGAVARYIRSSDDEKEAEARCSYAISNKHANDVTYEAILDQIEKYPNSKELILIESKVAKSCQTQRVFNRTVEIIEKYGRSGHLWDLAASRPIELSDDSILNFIRVCSKQETVGPVGLMLRELCDNEAVSKELAEKILMLDDPSLVASQAYLLAHSDVRVDPEVLVHLLNQGIPKLSELVRLKMNSTDVLGWSLGENRHVKTRESFFLGEARWKMPKFKKSSDPIYVPLDERLKKASSNDPKAVKSVAKDVDDGVRSTVAGNTKADPSDLAVLASDLNSIIRLEVARNKSAYPETISKLARSDKDLSVRTLAIQNPRLPIEDLLDLQSDENFTISELAKVVLSKKDVLGWSLGDK